MATGAETQVEIEAPQRGRLVSRGEIVAAALAIAQRLGVAGVTMRTLADELGVSVATAYYHVEDKAELLRLMAEATLEQVRCPSTRLAWDVRLLTLALDVRRTTARCPGLFPDVPGVTEGPGIGRLTECTVGMLRDAGLREFEVQSALVAVATYIWGQLLLDTLGRQAIAARPGDAPPAPAAADSDTAFEAGFQILLDGIRHRAR